MHTAMRLVAFMLLLVTGVLWLSYMRGSEETAVDRLNGVVPQLTEAGFQPSPAEVPAVETITDFSDHWLQQYAPGIFEGVKSINVLDVRMTDPVGIDYYPEAVIEVWVYESDRLPERAVAILDSLSSNALVIRSPGEWWSSDDCMIYAHCRSELARPYLEEIAGMLRESF